MTVVQALAEGKALLAGTAGDSSSLDAALLLAEALGTTRSRLPLVDREEMPAEALARYRDYTERRAAGEPAAYILGRREFRGLDFLVSPAVLVPRPDTETLVEAALEYLREPDASMVLDLCTGSGAVAISLKHEKPGLAVYASDISGKALAAARENAARLLRSPDDAGLRGASGNLPVTFLRSDLFSAFPPALRGRFHLVAANPPYIERGAIPGLPAEVRREPEIALDGGEDGLDIIRRIVKETPLWLAPGGGLLLEAAPPLMRAIFVLLEKSGFSGIQLYRDLAGKERVIGARLRVSTAVEQGQ